MKYTYQSKKIAVKYCLKNGTYVPREKWLLVVTDTTDNDVTEFFYNDYKKVEEHIKQIEKWNIKGE